MDDHLQGWPLQGGATTEQYNPYQCLWIKGWQLWQSSCRSALERLLLDSMETSLQLSILYFYFISQQLQFCLTRLPVLFDKQYINAVFLYSEKGNAVINMLFSRQPKGRKIFEMINMMCLELQMQCTHGNFHPELLTEF